MEERLDSTERGFYLKLGDDFFGMYETPDGPKLFFNKDKYRLTDSKWEVELVIGRKNNLFIFYWQGETKISFRFNKNQDSVIQLYRLLQERVSSKRTR
ncbi:hypothetical protein ACFFNY_14340 [Paenibacillus hodogayensis]|uniref:Uncharacterized protein n=1 Tax=Paenibacillus hodogayensis TaxID=279208 RepID=A0ABV5VWY6_9BACL